MDDKSKEGRNEVQELNQVDKHIRARQFSSAKKLLLETLEKSMHGYLNAQPLASDVYLAHYTSVDTIYSILHDNAPESHDNAPESHDNAPESHDNAPEPHDNAPEPHDNAPEPHDNAPEPHDNAPEPHDNAPEPKKTKENQGSYLRLYEAHSLNDPNEGKHLKAELSKGYKWLENAKDDTEAFVCSFVSGRKPTGDEETIGNQLVFWQSYGKDGLGCSIELASHLNQNLFKKLKRVRYGTDGI